MSIDPYLILGVSRDASKDEIRAAYRTAAKLHHPDKGGDRAKFEEVTLAHDTLMDDDRRARFDQTGKIHGGEADNTQAEAIRRFIGGINEAVQKARLNASRSMPPKSPTEFDIIALAKNSLVDHVAEVNGQIKKFRSSIEFLEDLVPRFKKKGNSENFVVKIFDEDLRTLRSSIKSCEQEIAHTESALALFEDYSFETSKPNSGWNDDLSPNAKYLLMQMFGQGSPFGTGTVNRNAP